MASKSWNVAEQRTAARWSKEVGEPVPETDPQASISPKWRLGPPLIALLIFFGLVVNTAVRTAPTVDESVHIFRGRVLWQTGQMRFQEKHPPLSHWLIGSLLFTEPTLPNVTQLPSWPQEDRIRLAQEFLWEFEPQPNIERILLLARLPIVWLGVLLGAVVARWAWMLFGRIGQITALLLFALSPNLLAHFSLATTDGPLTAVYTAALFTWWRFSKRPSVGLWILAGLSLGLALGTKLTAIILLPILILLGYSDWRPGQPWQRPGLLWLSLLPVAGFFFWLSYGFELRPLAGIPFPIPAATYADSFFILQDSASLTTGAVTDFPAYLFGRTSEQGWWYYFIVAFLLKTPIPTLLLLGTAVFLIFRQRVGRATIHLWLPALILFAFASYSRLNIGYRHILPVLPLVFLLNAFAADSLLSKSSASAPRFIRTTALPLPLSAIAIFFLGLAAWIVVGVLRQHPHHLAYFNESIGGADQGYRYLADSNIDWGQSLTFFADYLTDYDEPVYLSYFGSADPAYYGYQTPPLFDDRSGAPLNLARANPSPGLYAISVNHFLGQVLMEGDFFDWFRSHEPAGNVGYSILLFAVPEAVPGTWIAHCLEPTPLLDQAEAARLVGQQELRHLYFDCRNSWVFPEDGSSGWYVLPQQDSWPVSDQFPSQLQPVYRHGASALEPSYAVWYWDGQADLSAWTADLAGRASLPVRFGDTADLTGYLVTDSVWWTIWQVQAPPNEPLTIGAHLTGAASTPLGADGLGFTSEQWQPDDWFIQMHSFEAGSDGRYLETGLYNYLTGERLPSNSNGRTGTFIQLPR